MGYQPPIVVARPRPAGVRWYAAWRLLVALLLPGLALPGATALASAEQRGLEIFAEADRRLSGYQDLQVDLHMVLRAANGAEHHRHLNIRQLEVPDDGDRYLIVFETPKPIKGTALLSYGHKFEPDEQWLFLPALQRVKKIASRNRSGPFLSSEFSFEDLSSQELEKFTYRFIEDAALEGVPGFLVERTPLDRYSGYARQQVWIDREHYRIQRVEYFDRRDELLKTLRVDDFKLYGQRFWKGRRMVMHNHRTRKSTELRWGDYVFGNGFLPERDFSANSLRRTH